MNLKVNEESILKFICSGFVLYYTWLRVIFPVTEGLLLPFGILMIGAILLYIFVRRVDLRTIVDFPIGTWIVFCLIELIVSVFIAKSVQVAISSIITFLELVLMCFAMVFIAKRDKDSQFLIRLMYVTSFGYTLSMLVNNSYIMGRLALVNANGDANVCLIGVVTATMLIKRHARLKNLFLVLTIFVMIYANLMTGSRKSLLCMLFYLFFWIIVFFRTDWKRIKSEKKLLIILAICTGLIVIIAVIPKAFSFVMDMTTVQRLLGGMTEGDNLRIGFYQQAFEYFKKNPLFGLGFNQFRMYDAKGYYSHSTYAEMLANGGIVGTVLFFMPHVWIVVKLLGIIKISKNDFGVRKQSMLLLVYMISSLLLAAGMVQTSNEKVLMMYAVMYGYIVNWEETNKNHGRSI